MSYSGEEVDDLIRAIERCADKQIDTVGSAVKHRAAERDLLSTAEGARDLLLKAIKGDKTFLDSVFGGDCERIGRLRYVMDRVTLSDMHATDQRWGHLQEAIVSVEAILKDLGSYKPWVPPSARAPESVSYRGFRRRISPGRKVNIKPELEGGDITTFEVSPALPAGIEMNPTTGVITGAVEPGAIVEETVYVITARNAKGEVSTELAFGVGDPPPMGLAYQEAVGELSAGQKINWAPQLTSGFATGWSVAPALPTGLILDSATGVISGEAKQAVGSATYQVVASNSGGQSSVDLTFLVRLAVPRAPAYPDVPEGGLMLPVGAVVELAPEAPGPEVEFSIKPELPPGLEFNKATGEISGRPSEATEMVAYEVRARNESGEASATISLELRLTPPDSLSYPEAPRELFTGQPVVMEPKLAGGRPTEWQVDPALPSGLSLDAETGTITGTPAEALDESIWTVKASNSAGQTTVKLPLVVIFRLQPPSKLTYPRLLAAMMDDGALPLLRPLSIEPLVQGEVDEYAVVPALPVGLQLDTATGLISGVPTEPTEEATYDITASNSAGNAVVSLSFAVRMGPPSDLQYSEVPALLTAGVTEVQVAPSVEGVATTFVVKPAFPPGLALNEATGEIGGIPAGWADEAQYVITASNEAGQTSTSLTFAVTVPPPSDFSYPAAATACTVGEPLEWVPSLEGRLGTTFSVDQELPAGLVLDSNTGTISGEAEESVEERTYNVIATNNAGTVTAQLTFEVLEPIDVADTIDVNFAEAVDEITDIAELMEEPSKTKAFGDWMIWMVHRAHLNDESLTDFNFNNMHMPPSHIEKRIAPKLVQAIANNTHIETLSLVNANLLKAEGVELAKSLEINVTLKYLYLESNSLDSEAVRELAVAISKNEKCDIQHLKVTPQKQVGANFGRPVEEAFAQLMERNNNIVKLGLHCADANWRNVIDTRLIRNNDFARRRRATLMYGEEEAPAEARGDFNRVILRRPPQKRLAEVFEDKPVVKSFQKYVAQNKRLPTSTQFQSFARNNGTPLKYSEVAPALRECRTQMLGAAVGTEVTIADAFEAEMEGALRSWSDKNDNWSFEIQAGQKRYAYTQSLKEPAIQVSEEWSTWLQD